MRNSAGIRGFREQGRAQRTSHFFALASDFNRRNFPPWDRGGGVHNCAADLETMRWILFATTLTLLCATAAFAQTKVSGQQNVSYEGQKVGSIELIANPRLNTEEFRSLVLQKAGQPYSQKDVDASIKSLEQTNAFAKVDFKVVPDPSGLKLTFVLEPAYWIGLIRFPGAIQRFSYTRLLQVVNLPDQTPYKQSQMPDVQNALLGFFHEYGYFQAQVHTEVQTDDQNLLANITFRVTLGKHAHFGRVGITGGSPQEDHRLYGTLGSFWARFTGGFLRPGKPYGPGRIKSAVARLKRELGKEHYLANKIEVGEPVYHADTNRADLSIKVDPGPKVDLRIVGAKLSWIPFLSTREEKKDIPIYQENAVDPDLVAEGERNLANFFQKKGYYDVKVSSNFQQQNGNVLLTYTIDKGRKHVVKEIAYRGNHHLSEDALDTQMAIKKQHLHFLRGSFSQKLLRTSATNIENLYKDNGFEDVKVTPEVVDREPNLYVTFYIAEGDRTVVSSLKIEGNQKVPLKQLRPQAGFELAEGKPFSPRRLSNDRNGIAARYLDRGFLNSEVKTVISRHPDDPHQIDVAYQITENQQVRISRILNLGQEHTKLALIQKGADLHPEQPLSEGKLLQSESHLYDLSIFDWASIGPRKPITSQSEEEAVVKVHEAKRNSITYGFGFEISRRGGNIPTGTVAVPGLPTINTQGAKLFPSEKTFVSPRGSFEFVRKNMRGRAETAAVSLLAARLDQRFLFTYTDPHFRYSNWQALTSLSAERNTQNPLFEARLGDASLEFQRYLDRKNTIQLQVRYDFNRTRLSKLLVPELVLPEDRNVNLSFVSGTILHDTRDKPLDAHTGVYQTLDLRIVPSAFGSSANFARLLGQYAYYKPFHSLVFANSVRLGLASPFASSRVPTSERFFAGGGTTLRGFPINEAGPIRYVPFCSPGQTSGCPQVPVPVGGNQLFVFNSELRYPIPIISNLGGVVFYDGGNVYRRINFPDFINNYTNTVGVGLRYNTPIGPIRFDIGRNLNPPAGISATQFFITLGQAF